jgi:hypothetical protein
MGFYKYVAPMVLYSEARDLASYQDWGAERRLVGTLAPLQAFNEDREWKIEDGIRSGTRGTHPSEKWRLGGSLALPI